jgi:hypothetical protein
MKMADLLPIEEVKNPEKLKEDRLKEYLQAFGSPADGKKAQLVSRFKELQTNYVAFVKSPEAKGVKNKIEAFKQKSGVSTPSTPAPTPTTTSIPKKRQMDEKDTSEKDEISEGSDGEKQKTKRRKTGEESGSEPDEDKKKKGTSRTSTRKSNVKRRETIAAVPSKSAQSRAPAPLVVQESDNNRTSSFKFDEPHETQSIPPLDEVQFRGNPDQVSKSNAPMQQRVPSQPISFQQTSSQPQVVQQPPIQPIVHQQPSYQQPPPIVYQQPSYQQPPQIVHQQPSYQPPTTLTPLYQVLFQYRPFNPPFSEAYSICRQMIELAIQNGLSEARITIDLDRLKMVKLNEELHISFSEDVIQTIQSIIHFDRLRVSLAFSCESNQPVTFLKESSWFYRLINTTKSLQFNEMIQTNDLSIELVIHLDNPRNPSVYSEPLALVGSKNFQAHVKRSEVTENDTKKYHCIWYIPINLHEEQEGEPYSLQGVDMNCFSVSTQQ